MIQRTQLHARMCTALAASGMIVLAATSIGKVHAQTQIVEVDVGRPDREWKIPQIGLDIAQIGVACRPRAERGWRIENSGVGSAGKESCKPILRRFGVNKIEIAG